MEFSKENLFDIRDAFTDISDNYGVDIRYYAPIENSMGWIIEGEDLKIVHTELSNYFFN